MATEDTAILVENLHKTFRLPHEKVTSVKGAFLNLFRGSRQYEKQQVLGGVSFEIKKGEFFGIVGRNGSGKSTLLKLMAGIYAQDRGEIKIIGSLTPFIELGVGFNPELTGRENVYLNGALLGFNRKEMTAMYDEIVAFAELERFMDQKLKNYSSGMQVRLAFSIAIRAQSDILLLDEVLAVGDSAFQRKCYDYFGSLKKGNRTIILVSHNMQVVEQFCERALLLEKGKIVDIGNSSKIGAMYEEMFLREEADHLATAGKNVSGEAVELITVHEVRTLQGGKPQKKISADQDFDIEVTLESKTDIPKGNVGINIKNHDRILLASADTHNWHGDLPLKANTKLTVTFRVQNIFSNDVYSINIGIADYEPTVPKILYRIDAAAEFLIQGVDFHKKSLVRPDIKVSVTR